MTQVSTEISSFSQFISFLLWNSCAMAADQILSSSYFKYSDERQLIDEEEDIWLEDLDDDRAEISVKHVHFVTDATLSSWKEQDAAAYYSNTSMG